MIDEDGTMGSMKVLNHGDKAPVYLELAERLEAAVLRGEYRPGDRLPSERKLSETHSVNRHTAGQALRHLQSKGLVIRTRGRGTIVHKGRVEYRTTKTVTFAQAMSRVGLGASKKVLSVRRVRARKQAARGLGIAERGPLVVVESISHAGEVALDYGIYHFPEDLFPGLHRVARESDSMWQLLRARYGARMRRARCVFEIDPAGEDAAHHLGVPSGFPLLKVENLYTLEDGTPAQWGFSHFRGDVARIAVEMGPVRGGEDWMPHDDVGKT